MKTNLKVSTLAALAAAAFVATPALAQSLTPLSTFGGGDGWLAPDEATFLQGANTQRGIAYNPTNNHVYVADRNTGTFIRVLDGDTGALITSLDTTGIAGGTFTINQIDVGGDGAIYVGNLATSAAANFKVYRYANEAATPTLAYDAPSGLARTGDTFAVSGSGAGTRLAASGSGGAVGYAYFTTTDGLNYTASVQNPANAPTGAFRLGLDLVDADTVVGKQTGTPIYTADVGGAATVGAVNSAGEAPLGTFVGAGLSLLGTVDINSNDVRLYDYSDPSAIAPNFLDLENNTSSFVANPNGAGDVSFGLNGGLLRVYALNTNNGIQAFTVAIPEPTSLAALGLGGAGLLARRRRA